MSKISLNMTLLKASMSDANWLDEIDVLNAVRSYGDKRRIETVTVDSGPLVSVDVPDAQEETLEEVTEIVEQMQAMSATPTPTF